MSKKNKKIITLKMREIVMDLLHNLQQLSEDLTSQTAQKLSSAQRCRLILIEAIKQGILPPGQKLIEADLGKALFVSRTPLREALAALRAVGVIEADGQTMRVRKLFWRDIHDLYEMRTLLEGAAAKNAARHSGPAEKQLLEQLIEAEETLINNAAKPQELAEHNRQFHNAIMQTARNEFLRESLDKLSHLFVLIGDTAYQLEDRSFSAHLQHKAIADAICYGNEVRAQQAMEDHLKDALAARLRILSISDETL